MIPVAPAPGPATFDDRVRQRGLAAIDELIGRKPRRPRPGPRRKPVAKRAEDVPARCFPDFWRLALDELLVAYQRRCAYLALYLEPATGSPSVDHMLPKSKAWDQVYEWLNYRLCASLVNATKGDRSDMLDPFEIGERWFGLELVGFQVVVGPDAPARQRAAIEQTIVGVGLNQPECCRAREEYVVRYQGGDISLAYLRQRAPFVAAELSRQGRL